MTLEELRSRLIEVCKGKEKFVEALKMIANRVNSEDWRFNFCDKKLIDKLEQANYVLDCPSELHCDACPMDSFRNVAGIDCRWPNLCMPEIDSETLREFANETLNLAIASCKVEEEVPADNPSKPLFIVTKVDDLIGLESEDGKFRICRNSNAMGVVYEVIGVKSFFPYYQFEKLNLEAEQILGELGFRFTIQERKSYLELLEECEEVEFEVTGNSNYYIGRDLESGVVRIGGVKDWFIPGVKYISGEDADRIVKECVENA